MIPHAHINSALPRSYHRYSLSSSSLCSLYFVGGRICSWRWPQESLGKACRVAVHIWFNENSISILHCSEIIDALLRIAEGTWQWTDDGIVGHSLRLLWVSCSVFVSVLTPIPDSVGKLALLKQEILQSQNRIELIELKRCEKCNWFYTETVKCHTHLIVHAPHDDSFRTHIEMNAKPLRLAPIYVTASRKLCTSPAARFGAIKSTCANGLINFNLRTFIKNERQRPNVPNRWANMCVVSLLLLLHCRLTANFPLHRPHRGPALSLCNIQTKIIIKMHHQAMRYAAK